VIGSEPAGPPLTAEIFDVRLPTPSPGVFPTEQPLLPPDILTTQQMHDRLDPFGEAIPGCSLPCYNGLIMGQATLLDTYNFYARLGIGIPDLIPGDYQAIQDGEGQLRAWLTKTADADRAEEMGLGAPLVAVSIAHNTPEALYVNWSYEPPYLSVSTILGQAGEPDQLELALLFSEEPPVYVLVMVYDGWNGGFAFTGLTTGDATTRRVCLSDSQVRVTTMGLFAPGLSPMEDLPNNRFLLPLSEVLGISIAEFATRIAAGDCIDIPASTWPAWRALQ